MEDKINQLNFNGQKVFIGLDVHLKSWKATIMLEETPFKTFSQDPCAATLRNYLDKNFPNGEYYSAYEAGFCGFSVHRELLSCGINNIIVNPADIPTTDKEKKQKEDMRDSRKIARSLKNGDLKAIYVPERNIEELRLLVRYRKTIVREISRNKTRVKAFLHCNGVQIPRELDSASQHWSSIFTKWLKTVKLTTDYGHIVLQKLLEIVEHYRRTLLSISKDLKKIIEQNESYNSIVKKLRSIPGIGFVVAITILTEIVNIRRFKNLDKLCSFVGLIPTTHSTSDKDITGTITRRSNKPLRDVLVESAWVAVRNDSSMSLAYSKLCKRMKPNKAIIRITKKLLNRIRFVLLNDEQYEFEKIEQRKGSIQKSVSF
jgi:transposase